MDIQFGQIFKFRYKQATKRENSSYLEDLTKLLSTAAARIDSDDAYFFGDEFYLGENPVEPNADYNKFINSLQLSFDGGSRKKITIIRGKAGVGKTLFFERGMQKLISNKKNGKYIQMGVDFKNIDNDKDIRFYEEEIYKQLNENARDNIRFLNKCIQDTFIQEYSSYDQKPMTPNAYLFPLKYFCEKIDDLYGKPCIIVFDNIDLASLKTQKNVFKATVNVCHRFNKFMEFSENPDCYRIYFAMRPETELYSNEAKLGDAINFPLPNLLKIFLAVVKDILTKTAQDFDKKQKIKCNVTCKNILDDNSMITFKTYEDVAKHFCEILDFYLNDIWDERISDRLGDSEEFHCKIVNYNVRKFLCFMADTISNGGFKPLTTEFNNQATGYYNVFDYVEMIIRGRWQVHPGNIHIDGEGGNKAPIIFNVFDTDLYTGSNKVKHFMLYIRIIQYFSIHTNNISIGYSDLEEYLSNFFEQKYINKAVQKLTHIRILDSAALGEEAIASIQNWSEVEITDKTQLILSDIGKFYLDKLIYEFEYLYQMALSSLMNIEYINELSCCWKTEKELTVLYFLRSIFEIIKNNIDNYDDKTRESFKEVFYEGDVDINCHPFRKMIYSFIRVMNSKVQSAQKYETLRVDKLQKILNDSISLKKEAENYFVKTLGD